MMSTASNETFDQNPTKAGISTFSWSGGLHSSVTLRATPAEAQLSDPVTLNTLHFVLISISVFSIIMIIVLAFLWQKKYQQLVGTIQELQAVRTPAPMPLKPQPNTRLISVSEDNVNVLLGQDLVTPLERQATKSALPSLWRPEQGTALINRNDICLQQLIKAGREGVFYKAKLVRGTCKGHSMIICKISKEETSRKRLEREISIMRKLGNHNNLLQLLDWDITNTPYMLIMDFASLGTLRSYLQVNQEKLQMDSDLQHHFTIAAYHIAHAMDHLRSKMVIHCDLALRNIMVNRFPSEVKVTEFGLARDLTRMSSRRSSRKKSHRDRVPLRWYPPEYFKNNYYGFKGDVWSFGIILWEMQTFGSLPYPNLQMSEEVIRNICAGYRNTEPDGCRMEILQMMRDCWMEPYNLRPTFKDIVRVLENILETDCDYVDVNSCKEDLND
ncbi:fibroblast growth factor receptor 1-like isoform X2 [Denticeps clupeoides]|nr:fibroblast growth factor receptor 1-like isoform X2 [Denticeps clupeoides]